MAVILLKKLNDTVSNACLCSVLPRRIWPQTSCVMFVLNIIINGPHLKSQGNVKPQLSEAI